MEIRVCRFLHQDESTLSLVAINETGTGEKGAKLECFGLEDQYREVKVKHDTRIPEGTYEVGFMEQLTPMTEKYRKRFPWFTYHLHVREVPNFTSIYIHIGNTEEDTSGCLLVGSDIQANLNGKASTITGSTAAYEKLYKKVSQAIRNGERVTITYLSIYK